MFGKDIISVLAVVALVVGSGCGGRSGPERTLRLDAARDNDLRFARDALTTHAGRVAIAMGNPSKIPHAVAIRGGGADATGGTVNTGDTSVVEADLRAGTYELYCPVGGHEQAGMTARLTVR